MMIAILLTLAGITDAAPDARKTVDVLAQDKAAQSQPLADAVTAALAHPGALRAPTPEEDADVRLVIMSSGDGKKFSYIADLVDAKSFSPRRIASFAGKCRADAMDACASDILKRAGKKVEG